ncbi:hypothetical protein A1O3_09984 [Capronia epimyces CBS 606.96]|uniref:superoxide dismutase n=1 Tax=Capronia epimyces CBS 606.96 TaxID=1182542 RepID=W9XK68_9EURO|nr:uncharacterized protein A1O3_09984 [Capronia epimyces CBS 606.96]EXJ77755.1 hypothetical protein A1O3_09984 [Capronia epimyces CBS 606.96]
MKLLTFMLSLIVLTVSALAQQQASDAPITEDNPKMATFQAVLQEGKPIQGHITGVSNGNGTGVNFNINLYDFPDAAMGPFKYHIHELPVPQDGNCTGTGGHLSPYGRNDTPACDASQPGTCQPGDLSGKHGAISDTAREKSFQVTYLDLYLSTNPRSASFFGNRSVVVHAANGTRLNCGNFTQQLAQNATGTGGTSTTTTTGGTTTPTGAGQALAAASEIGLVFAAAMLAYAVGSM